MFHYFRFLSSFIKIIVVRIGIRIRIYCFIFSPVKSVLESLLFAANSLRLELLSHLFHVEWRR
jgi:hypothetical protein